MTLLPHHLLSWFKVCTLSSKVCLLSLRCWWTAESWTVKLANLFCAKCICIWFLQCIGGGTPHCIELHALHCFVLRVDQLMSTSAWICRLTGMQRFSRLFYCFDQHPDGIITCLKCFLFSPLFLWVQFVLCTADFRWLVFQWVIGAKKWILVFRFSLWVGFCTAFKWSDLCMAQNSSFIVL